MNSDEELMTLALEVAASADFRQSPNPMVGCVIARGGEVIATGAHLYAGEVHAEIMALKKAGAAAVGADMFITLEPCSVQGRTPPCVDQVIATRPRRVIVAMLDPNPKVNGKGVEALRHAGIDVVVGIKESNARQLNQFYIKHIDSGKPFVTAKFAASLDGRIATRTGDSKWISSAASRTRAHQLRHEHDAIMVGIGTVLADDPALTARFDGARQPVRIVVDSHLRLPDQAQLLHQPEGLIVATSRAAIMERQQRYQALQTAGVQILGLEPTSDGRVNLEALLAALGQKELISVLVEGGASLLGSLFDQGLIDRVVAFIAPRIIGGQEALAAVGGNGVSSPSEAWLLQEVNVEHSGGDMVVSGWVVAPTPIQRKVDMSKPQLVSRVASSSLPTEFGTFALHAFDETNLIPTTHLALVLGDIDDSAPVLTRVHSECLTGDVFGSMRCDCQAQLLKALALISQEGRGALVYLRQEGRGSGLSSKISAYALQDQGMDTVEADQHLGVPVDERDYGIARKIMVDLGISKIKLLTNNPHKVTGVQSSELEVTQQIPLVVPPTKYNARYLETKRTKLGHLLQPNSESKE